MPSGAEWEARLRTEIDKAMPDVIHVRSGLGLRAPVDMTDWKAAIVERLVRLFEEEKET